MKLSELAKCLKILEIMKWELYAGKYDNCQNMTIGKKRSPEFYCINRFPFLSAFCYVFRAYEMQTKVADSQFNCFCPRYNNGINCSFSKDSHRKTELQVAESIYAISTVKLMKYLKKLPLQKLSYQIRELHKIWNSESVQLFVQRCEKEGIDLNA